MWNKTRATEILNIEYPIIQAPMAGITTPELVAAVSNAGGLGSLGAGYMEPDVLRTNIQKIRQHTSKPFNINLFAPREPIKPSAEESSFMNQLLQPYRDELGLPPPKSINRFAQDFDKQMQVLIEERVPIFSFTFGIPDKKYLKALKQQGTLLIGTATSIKEAQKNEKVGVDLIVAQGLEAGGHRGAFLPSEGFMWNTIELLPQIIKHTKLPVIAAGGMMNSDDVSAALHLRASAVQMGTAFLVTHESGANQKHKDAILALKEDNTVITKVFSGKFSRAIKNKFIEDMVQHESAILDYPIQGTYTKDIRRAAAEQGRPDFMSLWAGSFAYMAEAKPAAALVKDLVKQLEELF